MLYEVITVVIDEGLTRFYPYGERGAQVLGYVSSVSERDLTGEALLELVITSYSIHYTKLYDYVSNLA